MNFELYKVKNDKTNFTKKKLKWCIIKKKKVKHYE